MRIGVVNAEAPSPTSRALEQGLRERGWIDGKNARIFWRPLNDRFDLGNGFADELAGMPVDVLVTSLNWVAQRASRKAPGLPIVLASSDLPVESKLAVSYSRPGGNITGLNTWAGNDVDTKRLAILSEFPQVSKVAVFGPPLRPGEKPFMEHGQTAEAANKLGLSLIYVRVNRREELPGSFERARRDGANAVLISDYAFAYLGPNQLQFISLANQFKWPLLSASSTAAERGALLTYGIDIEESFRRAGHIADKILRGTKPADIPIENPRKVELVVNLKAARAAGIAIPQSVLLQAARIID